MPAIAIVKRVQNRKYSYELDEEALKKILTPRIKDMKVAVISVAGAFRKGKSFLLNFFVLYLNSLKKSSSESSNEWFTDSTQLNCFPWKGGSQADTNGILMWSEPFILRDKVGNEVAVLLMDTQGSFDTTATVADCATIFALSTMISSLQIYNISSDIQEDYLQHLRLFLEYGSLAKQTTGKPFQSLLFLIRDWSKSYEHEHGYGGGENYLKQTLKITDKQKPELRELREKICNYFEDLSCFLLPHPGLKIAESRDLDSVGKIKRIFKEHILQFVPSLFSPDKLVTKKMNGQPITCEQLMHYIKAYMDVFNSDTLPEPMTVYHATAEANHTIAVSIAKTHYEKEMQPVMDSNISDTNLLLEEHRAAEDNAVRKFEGTPKMGDEELTKKHREILNEHIKARYCEFANIVKERARLAQQREQQIREKEENERVARLERERLIRERREAEAQERRIREDLERQRVEQEEQAEMAREELRQQRREQQIEFEEQRRQMQRDIEEQERRAAELTGEAQRVAEEQARTLRDAEMRLNEEMRAFEEHRRNAEREDQDRRDQARQEEEERRDQRRREDEERRVEREREQQAAAAEAQRIADEQTRRLNEQQRALEEQRRNAEREDQDRRDRARQEEEERRDRIRREDDERRRREEEERRARGGNIITHLANAVEAVATAVAVGVQAVTLGAGARRIP